MSKGSIEFPKEFSWGASTSAYQVGVVSTWFQRQPFKCLNGMVLSILTVTTMVVVR